MKNQFLRARNFSNHLQFSLIVVMFLLSGLPRAEAQNSISDRIPQYLFSSFADGMVVKKSGERVVTALNYNIVTEEMIFKQGNRYLALGDLSSIDTIYLNQMIFLPVTSAFYELAVMGENRLLVQFSGTVRVKGEDVGFGVTSQTSRITSLSAITNSGALYNMDLPENLLVSRNITYHIEKDGELRRFVNERAFLKIFRDRKDEIKILIKELKVDFGNYNDVIALIEEVNLLD